MANDVQQGKALGEFAAKQGVKTVAIVDDRTAYGQGLPTSSRKPPKLPASRSSPPNTPTTRRPTSRPS
jgi:hypothetical protein